MHTIYKYEIPMAGEFTIQMPEGAQVLDIQVQREAPMMWVLVDPEKPIKHRHFRMYGTGHPISDDIAVLYHHGSFQLQNGNFLGHVFEVTTNG